MKKAKSVSKRNSLLKSLIGVPIAAVLLHFLVIQPFTVDGISMNPTLGDNERVIVNKLGYLQINLKDPKDFLLFLDDTSSDDAFTIAAAIRRGDIVVASRVIPGPRGEKPVIKRVVGIPGDTFEIRNGFVYINEKRFTEPYVLQRDNSNYPTVKLGLEEYFLLGDNRLHSGDSRHWGPMPRRNIVGKVWFAIWPPSRFGTF